MITPIGHTHNARALYCTFPSIVGLTLPTPSAMVDMVLLRGDEFAQRDVCNDPSVASVQLPIGSSKPRYPASVSLVE